jgi:two-component system, OmpR family, response regulator Irr
MLAKILVVEDDRVSRNLICEVLRNEGHQLFETNNGAEALELFHVHCFDLVITDFVMPKLNGLMLIKQLHLFQPRLPIIFITAYLSIISDKTMLKDVIEVLPKQFEVDFLRSTVQRLLINSAC